MKNLSFVSSTRLSIILAFSFFILSLFISIQSAHANIRPSSADKFYWQYNGSPVLLLGGSNNDNLFQTATESYMNEMKNAGVNYLRNVMSDRDTGDLRAFHRRSDGKYDLNQWNNAYWTKFENFLRMARDREMIVQIEVWDRFDHAVGSAHEPQISDNWGRSPWNPANNINYTTTQSGLATSYGTSYLYSNQPFFYTVPALRNNTTVLQYQNKFVDKMLSISLNYPTVIYSIDNETSSLPEWGRYWAQRIKTAATAKGKTVYITEMYEQGFDITAPHWKYVFDYPNFYSFSEISMHNYHIGDQHWNGIQWARNYLASRNRPWPLNNVKNSGNDNNTINSSGRNTARHALERFWRHVLGGSAGVRFHRDQGGLGLNSQARAAIAAARKLETMVKMWEVNPSNHLLSSRASNEAYLAAKPGEKYALYFTNGGSVGLNLSAHPGSYILRWINPQTGNWGTERTISGGGTVNITAPSSGHWVAAIVKEGLTSSTPTPTPTTTTAPTTSPEPTTVSPTSPVTTSVTGSENVSTVAALLDGTIYLSSGGSIVSGADVSNLAFFVSFTMYSILQRLPPKAQKQVLVIRWK